MAATEITQRITVLCSKKRVAWKLFFSPRDSMTEI